MSGILGNYPYLDEQEQPAQPSDTIDPIAEFNRRWCELIFTRPFWQFHFEAEGEPVKIH